jgi:hypothetical protein
MNRKVPTSVVVTRCRIEHVGHCDDETIRRMVEFLNSSPKKRRGREHFVFTCPANGTAVPVWQAAKPGSKTARRLAFFEREMHKAGKSPEGRRALLLGAQFAQLLDELRYSHLVAARWLQTDGGASRTLATQQEQVFFESFVWREYKDYKAHQKAIGARPTWPDFRKSWVGPLILRLKSSQHNKRRALGEKLMGTAGTDSDGIMSARQLNRAWQAVESKRKNK